MKYYIIAGEASGDLHGSNLMKALKKDDPEAQFRIWGGDRMQSQGGELVQHYKNVAFMGFLEVIINLRTILKNIAFCKKDITAYQPDAVILIDYPGFNLRIADFVKNAGIKTFYYISPQVWAWKQSRVHKIMDSVDQLFVILPFEKDFYKKYNYDVDFVGHPLLDAISDYNANKISEEEFSARHSLQKKKIVALLPGSRKQEIQVMLPEMLSIIDYYPDHQFVIAGISNFGKSFYEKMVGSKNVALIYDQTYELLQYADAALVTSGTATLETALFGVPEVVCYKGSKVSFMIAKQLVKVDYISLVNLVMEKEVVKELIQQEMNSKNIKEELDKILSDSNNRTGILKDYQLLKEKLGGEGASKKTSNLLLKTLRAE